LSEDNENKSYFNSQNNIDRDSEIDLDSVLQRNTYYTNQEVKGDRIFPKTRGFIVTFRANVQEMEMLVALARRRGTALSNVIREAVSVYCNLLSGVKEIKSETVVINNPVVNINSPPPQQERDQPSEKRVRLLERKIKELEQSIREYEEEINRLEARNRDLQDKVKQYEERLMMLKTRVQFALDYLNLSIVS